MTQPNVLLTHDPIEMPPQDFPVGAGGIVDFWGVVRGTEDGRAINGIDYEAHSAMAEHQLQVIANAAQREFELCAVSILHRIGFVRQGEASLLVRACSRHRAAAFQASEWIVQELKKRVPIWKNMRFIDKVSVAA